MPEGDVIFPDGTYPPPQFLRSPLPADGAWRRSWEERLTAAGIDTAVDTSRPQLLVVVLLDQCLVQMPLPLLRTAARRLQIPVRQSKDQGNMRRWIMQHWDVPRVRQVVIQAFTDTCRTPLLRAPGLTRAKLAAYLRGRLEQTQDTSLCWLEFAWNAQHATDPAAALALMREVFGPTAWDAYESALVEQVEPFLWRVHMEPHIRRLDEQHHGAGTVRSLAEHALGLQGQTTVAQELHLQVTERVRELECQIPELDAALQLKADEIAAHQKLRQDLTGLLLDNMAAERRTWLEQVAAARAQPSIAPAPPRLPLAGRHLQVVADATSALITGTLARFLGAASVDLVVDQAAAAELSPRARETAPDLMVVVAPATVPLGLTQEPGVQVVSISIPGLLAIWSALQGVAHREEAP